jgi:hypothetical protein
MVTDLVRTTDFRVVRVVEQPNDRIKRDSEKKGASSRGKQPNLGTAKHFIFLQSACTLSSNLFGAVPARQRPRCPFIQLA